MNNYLSLISLGGVGTVTRNMYLYEYQDEILIIDCGLGFPDETMVGVDLLLPDISYLLTTNKKIVGMAITHGHEDHFGALPFVLPQLTDKYPDRKIPIYATKLTSAFANEKLKEFGLTQRVTPVEFDNKEIKLGQFSISFVRVTHSVPDTSHIFIKTPIGNFYHGSDFKFDSTPADGKISNIARIKEFGNQKVLGLLSDCLGSERQGRTPTESTIQNHFEREMRSTRGKFIVTTYSSNIARLNQIVETAEKVGRHICFIGRSLIKAKDVAKQLGYLKIKDGTELQINELQNYPDNKTALIVAGSQGQENSALSRIVNGEHKEVKITGDDVVIFSSDPIPGNEVVVYSLIDSIAKKAAKVLYSDLTGEFHVSGHGSRDDLTELITYVKPRYVLPISGMYRHMLAYRDLANKAGYENKNVLFLENGQELMFSGQEVKKGRLIKINNVYVDEFSGEELESFVLRDRQKLSEGGIIVVLAEIDASNGQLVGSPDLIIRGLTGFDMKKLSRKMTQDIRLALRGKMGKVSNWVYMRKVVEQVSERRIFREYRRRPMVIPVVLEV